MCIVSHARLVGNKGDYSWVLPSSAFLELKLCTVAYLKVPKIILSSIFIWNKLDALLRCEILCFTSLEGVTWYSCNSITIYIQSDVTKPGHIWACVHIKFGGAQM